MTTRHNLEQKAQRLRRLFVDYNGQITAIIDPQRLLTPIEQRKVTRYFRLMKRVHEDLCKVEAKLRKMP